MVYESRLPAVRLGNDARTKNHFSPTCVRKIWPICLLCEYLNNGCWITRRHLRFFSSLFAKSKPAKHAGSFEVRLETPLHRYNRDRPVFFFLWLRALIGRHMIIRCNAGEYFHDSTDDTIDNFNWKYVMSVRLDKFNVGLSATQI